MQYTSRRGGGLEPAYSVSCSLRSNLLHEHAPHLLSRLFLSSISNVVSYLSATSIKSLLLFKLRQAWTGIFNILFFSYLTNPRSISSLVLFLSSIGDVILYSGRILAALQSPSTRRKPHLPSRRSTPSSHSSLFLASLLLRSGGQYTSRLLEPGSSTPSYAPYAKRVKKPRPVAADFFEPVNSSVSSGVASTLSASTSPMNALLSVNLFVQSSSKDGKTGIRSESKCIPSDPFKDKANGLKDTDTLLAELCSMYIQPMDNGREATAFIKKTIEDKQIKLELDVFVDTLKNADGVNSVFAIPLVLPPPIINRSRVMSAGLILVDCPAPTSSSLPSTLVIPQSPPAVSEMKLDSSLTLLSTITSPSSSPLLRPASSQLKPLLQDLRIVNNNRLAHLYIDASHTRIRLMRATRSRTRRNVKGKRLVDGINDSIVSYSGSNESSVPPTQIDTSSPPGDVEAMLPGMSPLSDVSTLVANQSLKVFYVAKKCRRFRQEMNLFPQDSQLSSTCVPKSSTSRRVSKRRRGAGCVDRVPPEKKPKVQTVQLAVVEEGNFVLRIPGSMSDESVDMNVQISEPPSSRDQGQALRTFFGTIKNAFLSFWS
ncbi:hypothetical protein BDQ17DRAFT_1432720 [Cyathus striatus]|nr:hypothetical protein BDQ17DRAFT_1432720 [Cyathus striatus]